jgi:uncharacterized protein (TIGR04255 family)
LSLEHVTDEPLPAAQLKLVVAQVQHERLMAASDAKDALAIGRRLDASLEGPRPMATPGMVLQLGTPAEPSAALNLGGWQYVSEGRDWVATVTPDFFSLETLAYGAWPEFRTRLEELTTAVAEVLSPALVQRVGLRYVDELRIAGVVAPADWAGRIAPSFLGPAHDPEVGPSVTSIQQAVEIEGPGGAKVVLRHGTVLTAEGRPAYLLDHDCHHDGGRPFGTEELVREYDSLHLLALGVFQRAITGDFYRHLKEGAPSS